MKMSTNRNRAKLNKSVNNNSYRRIWLSILYPAFCDEGITFYPRWRKGFKNSNKCIEMYKIRMYKNWKHNRKTQYKMKKIEDAL